MAVARGAGPRAGSGWVCPNCRRHVPVYASVCHCGTHRADADLVAAVGAPRSSRSRGWPSLRGLPASFWLLIGVLLLSVVGMTVTLFRPIPRERPMPMLVGHFDRIPPAPLQAQRRPAARPTAQR